MKRLTSLFIMLLLIIAMVPTVDAAKPSAVRPILQCVMAHPDGTYTVYFGYQNTAKNTQTIPVGNKNMFSPAPEDRGQPTEFLPGRHVGSVPVTISGGSIAWKLGTRTVTVNVATNNKWCPPAQPTNLVANGISDSEIQLTWTASPDAVTYNVYRFDTALLLWSPLASNVADVTYTHTGLSCGTAVSYKVTAVGVKRESAVNTAPMASASTSDCTPPSASTLSATTIGDQQIDLSWTAADGADSYRLETFDGSLWNAVYSGTNLVFSHTGLSCGSQFTYRVMSINPYGETASNEVTPATALCDEAKPYIGLTVMGENQINVLWSGATGATAYTLQYVVGPDWNDAAAIELSTTHPADTVFEHTGLTCATDYTYRVTPDAGNASNPATARTAPCELLLNGSFEEGMVGWQKIKGARDKVVTEPATNPAFFTYGSKGLSMKGLLTTWRSNVKSGLRDVSTLTISSGETLNFTIHVRTKNAIVKPVLKITYTDGSVVSRVLAKIPKKVAFTTYTSSIVVPPSKLTGSTGVTKVRLILQYRGTTLRSRAWIDLVSLTYDNK